jgi:DNA invertase Pin-like site-specific DNA recombinase
MLTSQTKIRIVKQLNQKHRVMTTPCPIRVCAYIRVSTGHEEQQDSLRNQAEYYEQQLSTNLQYQFVGIFSDAGISGSKTNRPAFLSMLQKARAGEIDLIYTKSISRFARNTLTLLKTVRELKSIGVGIIFEEQNINTLNAEGELMLSVLAGIAEEERRSVRTDIQWSIQRRYQRGEAMVDTNRLLGFAKDENKNLVIVPEQAEIIRQIFRLYLSGVSAYKIAKILTDQNMPGCRAKAWHANRITSIISNEKYAGSCLMQKSFVNENGKQVKNHGQRAKYWIEHSHEAIISQSDWDQAQQIRKSRAPKRYPYTSLLRCAFCGCALIRCVHEKRWVSWICGRSLSQGISACIGSRIPEPRLIALTVEQPITEPVIVEEVRQDENCKRTRQKDYRFIPVSTYPANKPGS